MLSIEMDGMWLKGRCVKSKHRFLTELSVKFDLVFSSVVWFWDTDQLGLFEVELFMVVLCCDSSEHCGQRNHLKTGQNSQAQVPTTINCLAGESPLSPYCIRDSLGSENLSLILRLIIYFPRTDKRMMYLICKIEANRPIGVRTLGYIYNASSVD